MSAFGCVVARVVMLALAVCGCATPVPEDAPPASGMTVALTAAYAGTAACADCHAREYAAWQESLHAKAMRRVATDAVARFDAGTVTWGADASAAFELEADGQVVARIAEGGVPPRELPLAWLLGNRPIEQHLALTGNGELQALPIGYDTGKHEWFDLFPDDARAPGEFGHWAGRGMNANAQCIACHATDYRKGYDVGAGSYASRAAEAGVGCEACHGPGRAHVEARQREERDAYPTPDGARRLDTCAACHALRRELAEGFQAGERFLDFFEPVLLDEGDYHADGQLLRESYEWGSFMQSRMHAEGVVCEDCHEAHSGALRAEGNALCLGCHDDAFDAPAHTHHPPESVGAACVACHMPATMFMARDLRRDHSFPIPDPATTRELGVPNACGRCHADRDGAWSVEHVTTWFGDPGVRGPRREVARAFARGAERSAASGDRLLACLADCRSELWRASAAARLATVEGTRIAAALRAAAIDEDPLVRMAAVWALAERGVSDDATLRVLVRAAADSVRAVRVNAAWGLRAVPEEALPAADRGTVARALAAWLASTEPALDQPETHHMRGLFFAARGNADAAEAAYRQALALAPESIPPRQNLGMLYVHQGRIDAAVETFRQVVERESQFAPPRYALGMIYGERGEWQAAIEELVACLRADPQYPGAARALTFAYLELEAPNLARLTAETAAGHPGSRREGMETLVALHVRLGERDEARRHARAAVAEYPDLAALPHVARALED